MGYVFGQDDTDTLTIKDFYADFSPPDIGAFTLLGVSPSTISRPTTTEEITADILGLVSDKQNIPSGIAIEWTPWHTIVGNNKNIMTYRKNKFWSRLQISLGTTSDTSSTKIGYSLKWSYSGSDPLLNADFQKQLIAKMNQLQAANPFSVEFLVSFRNNHRNPFADSLNKFYPALDVSTIRDTLDQKKYFSLEVDYDNLKDIAIPDFEVLTQNYYKYLKSATNGKFNYDSSLSDADKLIMKMFEEMTRVYIDAVTELFAFDPSESVELSKLINKYHEKNWNRVGFQMGLGHLLESETNKWENVEAKTIGFYTSSTHPLYNSDNFFGVSLNPTVQFSNTLNADSAKTSYSILSGARLLAGYNKVRFSIEGLYEYKNIVESDFQDRVRGTIGIELKASNTIWFEIAFGFDRASINNNKASILSLGSLKYAFNKSPRFGL